MSGSVITIVLFSDLPANLAVAHDAGVQAAEWVQRSSGQRTAVAGITAENLEPNFADPAPDAGLAAEGAPNVPAPTPEAVSTPDPAPATTPQAAVTTTEPAITEPATPVLPTEVVAAAPGTHTSDADAALIDAVKAAHEASVAAEAAEADAEAALAAGDTTEDAPPAA